MAVSQELLPIFIGGAEDIAVARQCTAALQQQGGPAHAVQLPGFGSSPHRSEELTARSLCGLVRQELLRLPEGSPTVIVGHSMGGLAALVMAASAEVRRHFLLRGVVLLAPSFSLRDPLVDTVCRLLALLSSRPFARLAPLWRRLARPARVLNGTLRLRFPQGVLPLRALYRAAAAGSSAEPPPFVDGCLLDEEVPLNMVDLFYGLVFEALSCCPPIDLPLLLIEGTDDRWVPPCSAALRRRLRPVRSERVAGGHFFPAYDCAAITAAVRELGSA